MQSFLEVLKTFKFAVILVQIHTSLPLVRSELWLDSSRLFYLCKFNLEVHTKYWKGAFCIDYKAKFHRGKTSEISQAWSHTFLNLRYNSGHANHVWSVAR